MISILNSRITHHTTQFTGSYNSAPSQKRPITHKVVNSTAYTYCWHNLHKIITQ